MISAIGSGHCGQKLYAGSRGRPGENFVLLDKMCNKFGGGNTSDFSDLPLVGSV